MDKSEKDKRNVIQKSLPLMRLWRSPLTLPEFKILDLYLSRIDSHHPEHRKICFEKGEIERALGVQRILPKDLQERIRHLGIMVEVEELDEFGGFRSVSLLEEAVCHRDSDGLWHVELTCTPQAMKYIFNIENLGYLRYKLQSIASISSRYSYLLFLYVEHNRFRGSWEVEVDDLREYLGCDSELYQAYKEFNRRIMVRCQKELADKAGCIFSYDPIRSGRRVRRLRFTVASTIPPVLRDTAQPGDGENTEDLALSTDVDVSKVTPAEYGEEKELSPKELLLSACTPQGASEPEFSGADAQHILAMLAEVPLSAMPAMENFGGWPQLRRMTYLSERYAAMNRTAQTIPIQNRASYLISLIRQDVD